MKFFDNLILFFNLDRNIKKKIINTGLGIPVKLLNKDNHKYFTCPDNMPSEYCSKENFISTKVFLTDKNLKVKVVESFHGLNFEAPCDKYLLHISVID